MQRSAFRHPSPFAPVVIGCLYFVIASLALMTTRFEGGLAFIWGANALLMADLMTSRTGYWPRAIIACAIASIVSTALFGMGPIAALPMALINMTEAVVVATIYRRLLSGRKVAGSMKALGIFIFALCGVANVVAGLGAALVASNVTAVHLGAAWLQWYTGHVLGGLTCTPILIMLIQGEFKRWIQETPRRTKMEALALLLLFAAVTWRIFYHAHYPLLFAPLLPLVVIAFRIGHLGSAASIVILAAIGGAATISGQGPITMIEGSVGEHIQFLQLYLALSFLLSMPVAAELNGRRRLFRMLQESEARYRIIAEHSGDVVLNISIDGIIHYASPSATEQIGCAPDLLIGQPATDLVHPRDRAVVVATHRRALAHPGSVAKVEFRPQVSISAFDWCEMVTCAVVDERGVPTGFVSTIRDMTRHKARQDALKRAAAQDSLTGASSRRAFLDKLEAEMLRAGQGAQSCLVLIDIDHFKAVNDRYGHGAGDTVLSGFVERLRPGLRPGDSIGRLGGEEFAILLVDIDIDRARLICERLQRITSDPVAVGNGDHITVTFSAGLVQLDGRSSRTAMLEAADKALYRAKHSGRNCLRLAA